MKFRTGDKVRFLNEVGGGIVSGTREPSTVFVMMDNGLEIPYEEKQLVLVQRELLVAGSEAINMRDTGHPSEQSVYLIVEAAGSPFEGFRIYLVNASQYLVMFSYSIPDGIKREPISHGDLGPLQKMQLRHVKRHFFSEYPEHIFECLFFDNRSYHPVPALSITLKIGEKVLSGSKGIRHGGFNGPVHPFLLADLSDVPESTQEYSPPEIPASAKTKSQPVYEKEVDLHIEELVDDLRGLSNHNMLQIQMRKFEAELDVAISLGMKKITFIHGVGNGRLKQEITGVLKQTDGVEFRDAPYRKYGYGATEVLIH
jgi:hypothetical protein